MKPQTSVIVLLALPLLSVGLLVAALGGAPSPIRAQADPTSAQMTVDAFVQQAFTQTAQAGTPTANFTQTLEAAVINARTATAAAPTPSPTPSFQAARLRLASYQTYPLYAAPASTSAHLAPSGEVFAHLDGRSICLYRVTGEQIACTPEPRSLGGNIDAESVRWSPDSTRLVFIIDALRTDRDSDLWLYDTVRQRFDNLTDDNYDGRVFSGQDAGLLKLDLAPSWSPDGTQIAFLRYPIVTPRTERYRLEICILTLDDAAETCAEPFLGGDLPITAYTLDWSPDGDTLVFPIDSRQEGGILPGLWRYSLAEAEARLVVGRAEFEQAGARRLDYGQVEVSPDGRCVLVELPQATSDFSARYSPEASFFRVIDMEEREILLIDQERFVRSAGWLPNSGLFFISDTQDFQSDSPSNLGAPYFVYATDAPNGVARLLFTPEAIEIAEPIQRLIPPTSLGGKPLVWSAQDSTLLTTNGALTFLFTFAQE